MNACIFVAAHPSVAYSYKAGCSPSRRFAFLLLLKYFRPSPAVCVFPSSIALVLSAHFLF